MGTSETHPIGLTVEKTNTTTTKRGDHRDETRERETSFVSARLPETTTSFCRERKRERRAKAQRDVFVAINQFERRERSKRRRKEDHESHPTASEETETDALARGVVRGFHRHHGRRRSRLQQFAFGVRPNESPIWRRRSVRHDRANVDSRIDDERSGGETLPREGETIVRVGSDRRKDSESSEISRPRQRLVEFLPKRRRRRRRGRGRGRRDG